MVSNFLDTHRGGVEIVAGQLARRLARNDFDVTWLTASTTPTSTSDPNLPLKFIGLVMWNIAERRLGTPFPLFGLTGAWRLLRAVRACDVVILHDSVYPISVATFLATRWLRKPLLIVQHVGEVPFHNRVMRGLMAIANRCVAGPILARAEQVVFISEVVRDFFHNVKFKRQALLIFNGVDTTVFRPPREGEKATARLRFGLPAAAPLALFVGRFVEKKGLHLLRMAASLRPDTLWIFAGWGVLDPQAWKLPNVLVVRGLSGPDLADLYRASDTLVLPSQGEGFPLVIQEALACGLPVVCGMGAALADAEVTRHVLGIDIAPDDVVTVPERLAAAVDMAMTCNHNQAAQVRSSFAFQRYAWPAAAARYIEALRALKGRSQ